MSDIPGSIEDVDAEWLASCTGLSVSSVEVEQIGVGIGVSSAVYRLRLQGEGVPETLVLKLRALDEAAVFTSSVLRMYEREVKFFDELATQSPIRVPRGFHGAVSDDGATYALVMEDMGGHRQVDQNEGMTLADAERSVDELAAYHATFWRRAQPYVDSGAALSLRDEVYPAVLPMAFAEGWEKLQAGMDITPAIGAVARRWTEEMPSMLNRLCTEPTTVIHGDYRADNIFFDEDGGVVLLDFQLTGMGSGSSDLAYFVVQSLDAEVASTAERDLFDRYVDGLRTAGVAAEDTERLWDDYRLAALFCLVYPVVASRGMDLGDPRQFELLDKLNTRFARALEELALAELL